MSRTRTAGLVARVLMLGPALCWNRQQRSCRLSSCWTCPSVCWKGTPVCWKGTSVCWKGTSVCWTCPSFCWTYHAVCWTLLQTCMLLAMPGLVYKRHCFQAKAAPAVLTKLDPCLNIRHWHSTGMAHLILQLLTLISELCSPPLSKLRAQVQPMR